MEALAEYERKLDASEGFELPDLGGEPLEPRVFTSVYNDTADTRRHGALVARNGTTAEVTIDDIWVMDALRVVEVRKRRKRVRHAYELAGKGAVVKRTIALQDVLGEHQDSVVAETVLRNLASATPQSAMVAGRLIEHERARRADARSSWRASWKRLARAT